VLYQYRDIADVLLRQGVAVDTSSALTGRTPLLDAVMNGDSKTVDKLLQYSADPTVADNVSDADVAIWLFCAGAVVWVENRSYNHVSLVSNCIPCLSLRDHANASSSAILIGAVCRTGWRHPSYRGGCVRQREDRAVVAAGAPEQP
jgi:hypothetical protein